jgi:hypothetical protein
MGRIILEGSSSSGAVQREVNWDVQLVAGIQMQSMDSSTRLPVSFDPQGQ